MTIFKNYFKKLFFITILKHNYQTSPIPSRCLHFYVYLVLEFKNNIKTLKNLVLKKITISKF